MPGCIRSTRKRRWFFCYDEEVNLISGRKTPLFQHQLHNCCEPSRGIKKSKNFPARNFFLWTQNVRDDPWRGDNSSFSGIIPGWMRKDNFKYFISAKRINPTKREFPPPFPRDEGQVQGFRRDRIILIEEKKKRNTPKSGFCLRVTSKRSEVCFKSDQMERRGKNNGKPRRRTTPSQVVPFLPRKKKDLIFVTSNVVPDKF